MTRKLCEIRGKITVFIYFSTDVRSFYCRMSVYQRSLQIILRFLVCPAGPNSLFPLKVLACWRAHALNRKSRNNLQFKSVVLIGA